MKRGLKRLRAKHAWEEPVPRPAFIDEQSWAAFNAYSRDGLTVKGIGVSLGLSPSRVARMLYEVDARIEAARRAGPEGRPLVPESPIEDLVLSPRARNALHSLGCDRVKDVLGIDLSVARGMGIKTRGEVRAALRRSGLTPHQELDGPLDSEIRSLDHRLEQMRGSISAALEAVNKEIVLIQRRLRKRIDPSDSEPAEGVAPSYQEHRISTASQDGEMRYE